MFKNVQIQNINYNVYLYGDKKDNNSFKSNFIVLN